jgi:hypothetical protein
LPVDIEVVVFRKQRALIMACRAGSGGMLMLVDAGGGIRSKSRIQAQERSLRQAMARRFSR